MPTPVAGIDWSYFSMNSYLAAVDDGGGPVLDLPTWEAFTERLRAAGEFVMTATEDRPVDRASAVRGLLQHLEFGLRTTMGAANPYRPVFGRPWQQQYFDWGAANPDAIYRTVNVRDDATYRVSGQLGNAAFASFEFFDAVRQTGSLVTSDLRADADGRFDITFGPRKVDGTWFKVGPGTTTVMSREFFDDWASARPARLAIECLDPPQIQWPPQTPEFLTRQVDALGSWFTQTLGFFHGAHSAYAASSSNSFGDTPVRADSDLPYVYTGSYRLADDEVLLIEIPPGDCLYWGLQLTNDFWNTTNYTEHQSSLNNGQALPDEDGITRIVVAHHDPGVANWLDTSGITSGVMLLRVAPVPSGKPAVEPGDLSVTVNDWMEHWDGDQAPPRRAVAGPPAARVLGARALTAALPPQTRRVSPAERASVIDQRAQQIIAMQWGRPQPN